MGTRLTSLMSRAKSLHGYEASIPHGQGKKACMGTIVYETDYLLERVVVHSCYCY